MEKDRELLKKLVSSRRRDGRCTYNPEAKLELIRACLQPGVSIARLAMEHQVNANLLRTWVARYQRDHSKNPETSRVECKGERTDAFTPVQIETIAESHFSSGGLAVKDTVINANVEPTLSSIVPVSEAKANLSIRLHVKLPNGVGFDITEANVNTLLPILQMLNGLPCSDSTIR